MTASQETTQTNIRVLKPYRGRIKVGDVFIVQMPDNTYVYGRVVEAEIEAAGFPNSYLVYFYAYRSKKKGLPERRFLQADQLLLGPVFINRLPWSRGYFEKIGNVPLESGDRLKTECFWDAMTQKHLDIRGEPVRRPVKPYGDYGLSSYRTVDDKLSEALGFPLAPD